MKRTLFVLMAVTLVIISCSPKTQPQAGMKADAPLDNTRWKMVRIAGMENFPRLEKDVFIQFDKANNRFRGNAGCNNFNGGYTLEGSKLKLGPAAITKMFCAGDGMKVEDLFTKMMITIDGYEIKGDHMKLKIGSEVVAEFDALYL
ncbi:MAG TPA: META domain-containing protein [Chitinophagaceae bacterium]|nr:META domain-containing protein [Chitinophagaceae bacterium]